MNKLFEKYEITDEVKSICDDIEKIAEDFRGNTHDLLYEKVILKLNATLTKGKGVFDNIPSGTIVHRIRFNKEDNYPFDKISQISYPPQNTVRYFGRVNRPGQSMFYCAESATTCELELLHDYLLRNDNIGNESLVTYSEWETQKDLKIMILAIAPSHREINNGWTFRKDFEAFIDSLPTEERTPCINKYSLTNHFFLKKGSEDMSTYIICSAIANLFTLYHPDLDGFIFPSVQGCTGYNLVLLPHVINNGLVILKKVDMDKWHKSTNDKVSADNSFKTGEISGDNIVWEV